MPRTHVGTTSCGRSCCRSCGQQAVHVPNLADLQTCTQLPTPQSSPVLTAISFSSVQLGSFQLMIAAAATRTIFVAHHILLHLAHNLIPKRQPKKPQSSPFLAAISFSSVQLGSSLSLPSLNLRYVLSRRE